MEMVNCPRCKKLFCRLSDPICESCIKEEEALFQTVKKYIDDHPNNTLDEVSRETGASVKKIMKYMKDGRLETTTGIGAILKCEQCGCTIKSGKFCDACVISLNQEVTELFEQRNKPKVVMHTKQDK